MNKKYAIVGGKLVDGTGAQPIENSLVLVEEDGKVLAYFGIQPQGDRLFLSKFYILRENRGRGIFSVGIEFMKSLCREEGLTAIYLTVNRNNTHAYEVYLHTGFKVLRTEVNDIGNGFVMDDYIMQLEV